MPMRPSLSTLLQCITPSPAYRKTFRASSEAAVTILTTSVCVNPRCVAASRTVRRVTTMSPSVWIETSPDGWVLMPHSSSHSSWSGVGGVPVERAVHAQRGFHIVERKAHLRGCYSHGRLHSCNNRPPSHQGNHLGGFGDRPREERIQRFHRRNVENQALGGVALHSPQHVLLKCRHGGIVRVGRHRHQENVSHFDHGNIVVAGVHVACLLWSGALGRHG